MAINKHGYTSNTCMNCGAPTEGQTRCKDCMTMTARANKARRERYRSEGRCTICGTPARHQIAIGAERERRTRRTP